MNSDTKADKDAFIVHGNYAVNKLIHKQLAAHIDGGG